MLKGIKDTGFSAHTNSSFSPTGFVPNSVYRDFFYPKKEVEETEKNKDTDNEWQLPAVSHAPTFKGDYLSKKKNQEILE